MNTGVAFKTVIQKLEGQVMMSQRGRKKCQKSLKHTEKTLPVFVRANTDVYIKDRLRICTY